MQPNKVLNFALDNSDYVLIYCHIDKFLEKKVQGENFNRFIVIKDSWIGPYLSWVKVGISDLYNVEIVDGLEIGDVVYILPSKSLFDYQERFKKRVEGSFSFG